MKKIFLTVGLLIFIFLGWYLFFKPYDYVVRFKVKALPGTISQTIKSWGKSKNRLVSQNIKDLQTATQEFRFSDSIHAYNWHIEKINDSTSQVKAYVTDINNSLYNKIRIPFSDTDFQKRARNTILDFTEFLKNHKKNFSVVFKGEAEIPSSFCAYIPITTEQSSKAFGMMRNYSAINDFLLENNMSLNGKPFVEITNWDIPSDSITFNFCYPIVENDNLPTHAQIKFKKRKSQKALKAIYNGNYLTSDRAWYLLLNEASKAGIEIIPRPIEIFYNDPNQKGNELDWVAEIYMPLKLP